MKNLFLSTDENEKLFCLITLLESTSGNNIYNSNCYTTCEDCTKWECFVRCHCSMLGPYN